MKEQPAQVSYFFGPGYRDVWQNIRQNFKNGFDYVGEMWCRGETCESESALLRRMGKAFWYAGSIFSAILVPIICLVIAFFQVLFLAISMALYYVWFSFVAFADWVYRIFKRISTSCPECQEKFSLPTYVCTCGAQHTDLKPSKYGALNRTCECGQVLKTTFFNGREKLPGKWICPRCGHELSSGSGQGSPLQVDLPIPVIGGSSVGKTSFITAMISHLEQNATAYGMDFEYKPNHANGIMDDYDVNKKKLMMGMCLDKTTDSRLTYYQFYLTPQGKKVKNLISLCDITGESYKANSGIGSQAGMKNATEFIMVLDPLSFGEYRSEVESMGLIDVNSASTQGSDTVLNVLINALENIHGINGRSKIKTDVAIIFNKCDIPGLSEKIGTIAVDEYVKKHPGSTREEAQNKVCEKFFRQYGEMNFWNSLVSKFRNYQFFTCSALGRNFDPNNNTAFVPQNMDVIVKWIIKKAILSK